MKRARRRLCSPRRWASLAICFFLVLTVLPLESVLGKRSIPFLRSQGQQGNGQSRRVTPLSPQIGAPAENLPNLDELRSAAESNRHNASHVQAPRPIPSTQRSRRKRAASPGMQIPGSIVPGTIGSNRAAPNHSPGQTARWILRQTPNSRSHHARGYRQKESGDGNTESLIAAVQLGGTTENVVWTNVVGATASGNSLSKTAANAWGNAGAASNQSIVSGDGYVEFTATETGTDRICGLSNGDSNQDWTDVDFGLYLRGDGKASIVELGTYHGEIGMPFVTGDLMRVSVESGVVKYKKNGVVFYTSTIAPSYPLRVDTSLYTTGSTLSNVVISGNLSGGGTQNVAWINPVGVLASGNSLSKTAANAWGNAGAASNQSIVSGDGYVEFTATETGTDRICGLSNGDSNQDWTDVDFGLYLRGDGKASIVELGTYHGEIGMPFVAGDLMRVSVESGVVKYKKNGVVFYTSTIAPSYPLRVDTSLYTTGSTLSNVVISGNLIGSSGSSSSDFAMARLDPHNRTGTGGEDLLSNNFNWNLPLVSLPGRSGLDLGLTLSYNSLLWTKAGNSIGWDLDQGSVAPGFRLGFLTIEGPYWNNQANANFYLLETPSGATAELRQTGNTAIYESKDSSYLQLTDNLNGTMTLRPTDGTQMSFVTVNGAWRCNQIKDRNGNYITVTYETWGEIHEVTDTLGRTLTFHYDGNNNIQSITQQWAGQQQPHQWATFGWGDPLTIQTGFSGVTMMGIHNGDSVPVLRQVGLPDGSSYTFGYNGAGQVSTISRAASDTWNHSYTIYDYNSPTDDCPRLTQTRTWATNWSDQQGVPHEVATQFMHDTDGGCRMTMPDGTVYKEFYGSGWQAGLTTETRNYASVADANSNIWQKKTTTAWTQENPNVGYLTNPRVTQTDIEDASSNHRRTTVDYGDTNLGYVQWGLPYIVREFGVVNTTATELRRTQTDYNLNQPYLAQRIIGLVATQQLYDSVAGQWSAKMTYAYDATAIDPQATTATHHDTTYDQNYNSSSHKRGNVTSVTRWDVTNTNTSLTSTMTYNAAGSALSASDPLGHTNSISYTDSFSDNQNHNTFAYSTMLTDADGFSSTVQYKFDFGAKTRVEGPPPQNQPNGAIQNFTYDNAGRIQQVTTQNTGAYTRYVYGPDYIESLSSVNNVADEAYTFQLLNGRGQVFIAGGNHPGSVGGYKAQHVYYDVMGRVMKQSNSTEINGSWTPSGDDAAGWQYNLPSVYDWKGRPTKTYNMDGTYTEASYTGCGCAGGEVVTLTDEVGRRQRVYSDVLGRQWKTEVLNWDGTVYSTATRTLNARDQATLIRQYAGTDQSTTYQDTTMSFDGYGRLQSKHVPEQNGGTATVYSYNFDDTINSVTDARGASATYIYNNGRRLVNEIHYNAPTGITATSNVTFAYDAAGNRTSMTDGLGSATYNYNQLSQMISEARAFTGVGNFTLSYDYNLAGELKKITDATGMTINYGFDSTGRLSSVTGSDNLYAGVSSYASNFQYRAFGGLKAMTDGSSRTSSWLYNTRLQPSHYEVSGNLVSQSYDYYNDGRASFVHNLTDGNFDRSYSYDHVARVSGAKTGGQARGDSGATPYNEGFGYDTFNNLNSRSTVSWGTDQMSDSAAYTNNRRSGWGYDANGNNTTIGSRTYQFDAAGQMTLMTGQEWLSNGYLNVSEASAYDGDGNKLKEVVSGQSTYYLRSSVLNDAIVEEINSSGQKNVGYVYAGGELLAQQGTGAGVVWKHIDPMSSTEYGTYSGSSYADRTEFDPLGANVPLEYTAPPEAHNEGDIGAGQVGGIFDSRWANFFDTSSGCSVQGVAASCHDGMSALNNLGVARPNLIQVTINITWKNGQKRTIQFVTTSDVIKSGFNHTFRGNAAVAAVRSWNDNLNFGADNALLSSIAAGFEIEAAQNGYEVERKAAQKAIDIFKDNKDCREYIRKLMNNTGITVSLDPATTDYGMGLEAYIKAIDAGKVTASGVSGNKNGRTTYGVTTNYDTVRWNKEFYTELNDFDRGVFTIHEALHQIQGFSDQVLARAASLIADSKHPKSFAYTDAGTGEASEYLQRQIQSHCGRPETRPSGLVISP